MSGMRYAMLPALLVKPLFPLDDGRDIFIISISIRYMYLQGGR